MASHSAEIKWFSDQAEKLQKIYDMVQWIDDEDDSDGIRTDIYLATGLKGIGIKLREGRLEIKERIGNGKVLEINETSIGSMERWVKWSFDGSDGIIKPELQTLELNDSKHDWIPVRKERKLKMFGTKGYSLLAAKHGIHLDNGCAVDFSIVTFDDGHEIFSLGFEAFGDPDACERNLIYTLEQTLHEEAGFPDDSWSMSYPEALLCFS
jgi:hypothetical protein